MSPESSHLLLHEVAPRIGSAARHCIRFVGSEDHQEITQDTIVQAAVILINAEANHKKITAGNAAFYALQKAKSGRRAAGYSNADVLASATQLNGRSKLYSMEHAIPIADESSEEFAFSELFESDQEDPATLTARKLDWQDFLGTQTDKGRAIVHCLAEGGSLQSVATKFKVTISTMQYHKRRLTKSIKEFFGADILAQAVKPPEWKTNLLALRERHTAPVHDQPLPAASI